VEDDRWVLGAGHLWYLSGAHYKKSQYSHAFQQSTKVRALALFYAGRGRTACEYCPITSLLLD